MVASGTRWRLAVMMALLYAVQGAFWPLLAVHLTDLGIAGRARGWIFATLALGSLAFPLGAGYLVDRLMATQRVLALAYAIGTGFLVALACGVSTRADVLFGIFAVYWLILGPTAGLSTALALRHLEHPKREFGGVRLWGTIGWMVVGWVVSVVMTCAGSTRAGQGAYEAFWVAAVLSAVMAAYCLTLPDTPPLAGRAGAPSGPRAALALLRRPGLAVFLATAFGVSLTTPFVYQVMPGDLEARGLPRAWISTVMTLGQVPEIATLAILPALFRRLDIKGTLLLGIGAYVIRYASLAADPPLWIAVAGIPLHGVGIACFLVGGQVYLDGQAPPERRASAQALLVVLTSGLGSLLGCVLAGELAHAARGRLSLVFLVPCMVNAALLLYFCAGFRPHAVAPPRVGALDAESPLNTDHVQGTVPRVGNLVTESADG